MKKINLLKGMQRIPGGILLFPMLLSALITTLAPNLLMVGSPTQDLFSNQSTMVLMGLILFISGTQIDVKQLGPVLKKSGFLMGLKIVLASVLGLIYMNAFGYEGIFGLHSIALVAIVCSTNPGLYLAIVDNDDPIEVGVFAVLNFIAVPAFPMLIISAGSQGGIDILAVISTLFPLVLGVFLRSIDNDFGAHFKTGSKILLPFLGFSFGTRINILEAFNQIIPGILAVIVFYVLIALPMFLLERKVYKSNGVSSLAMSSVAGLSIAVPVLLSVGDITSSLVGQISFAVIITSIVTPLIIRKIKS